MPYHSLLLATWSKSPREQHSSPSKKHATCVACAVWHAGQTMSSKTVLPPCQASGHDVESISWTKTRLLSLFSTSWACNALSVRAHAWGLQVSQGIRQLAGPLPLACEGPPAVALAPLPQLPRVLPCGAERTQSASGVPLGLGGGRLLALTPLVASSV